MKKSVTLVEIIIAMMLLTVIVLGAVAFDTTSREFLLSSDRKTKVLNELSLAAGHFARYVPLATGDSNNPGIKVLTPTTLRIRADILNGINRLPQESPADYTDDIWVSYRTSGNDLQFCPNFNDAAGTCPAWETITDRFISLAASPFAISLTNGVVYVRNLATVYDPATYNPAAPAPRDNPIVTMVDTGGSPTLSFYSFSHTWN